MKKTIPAVTVLICDRCGKEFKPYEGSSGTHGKLERWGKSWNGDVGGVTTEIDFCSSCDAAFDKFLADGKPKDAKAQ